MASSFGGSVKLTGETEYRKALKDITNNLKVLNSEMKTITSQYDRNDKSVSNLSQQNEVLNKKIKEQEKVVKTLENALASAKEETGENSDTTKKWQIELNNAQSNLNKLQRELKSNNDTLDQQEKALQEVEDELKDYAEATDKAGQGSLSLGDIIKGNIISEGIITGVRALSNAMIQMGQALVGVGKQAFESYAQYEQLVGGVETLFKDSADLVIKYANESYITAGMSANTYMETVTGFSASLLQSLGGDTKKVAEVSNMAIIDMSDNANKMGTSIESIRYAYMGFAKQNYTMLDNLKLGYGGTKAEMQRLLADAQKITGIKYDINNLADVYNALHIIQGELGILGTTQKEANTTIEGSMNRLKASWENVLVGIADDEADFGTVINNFVESVVVAGQNILPRVEIIVNGIIELILTLADRIIEGFPAIMESGTKMLQSIMDGIVSALPQLGSVAGQVVTGLLQFIFDNLPAVLEAGIHLITELCNGLSQALPTLVPLAIDSIMTLVETLLDNLDLVLDAGLMLTMALAEGLVEALPRLIEKIPVIIGKLCEYITTNSPKILAQGVQLTITLADGIIRAIPTLLKAIPQIIKAIVNAYKEGYTSMISVGGDLLKGIWEGLKNKGEWLWSQVKGLMKNLTSKIKDFFGIHSPSTLFRDEVGTNLALGLGEGFSDTMSDVTKDMTNSIPTEFDTSVSLNGNSGSGFSYHSIVSAFKEALAEMKIELDDREVGSFVTRTVEREVFA